VLEDEEDHVEKLMAEATERQLETGGREGASEVNVELGKVGVVALLVLLEHQRLAEDITEGFVVRVALDARTQ